LCHAREFKISITQQTQYRKIELKIYGDLQKSSEVMARINGLASVILACLGECGRVVEF